MDLLKKMLLIVLTALLLYRTAAAAEGTSFSDVPQGHWAAANVSACARYGLVEGIGDGRFGLGLDMSRAAFLTALCRSMEWELIATEKGSFPDNQQTDAWYYRAMETAYAHGVLTRQERLCRPNDPITREEMAVMSVRALGYSLLAGTVSGADCPFKDVSANQGYITMAYQMGLVKGVDAFNFSAKRTATREEAATVLLRGFYLLHDVFSLQYVSAAPEGVETVKSRTGTSGTIPISPRASLEELYALAAGKGLRAVAIDAVPYAQHIKEGVVMSGTALTREELAAYIGRGKVYRSERHESSYVLCSEEDGTATVVWFESESDILAKAKLCRCLGIKELYVVR